MLLALIAMQALSGVQPVERAEDFVIVGRRLESRLEACIARNCPPGEEIEAWLDVAVNDFDQGRYDDAKKRLHRAIRRNGRHQAAEPRRVAALHATLSAVAEHEGDRRVQLHSGLQARRILARQVGADDLSTLHAGLDLGDAMMTQGDGRAAERFYREAQDNAFSAGQTRLAAMIAIRRANLASLRGRRSEGDRRLDEATVLARDDADVEAAIRVFRMQRAAAGGDQAAIHALIAQTRPLDAGAPVLVYSPPYAAELFETGALGAVGAAAPGVGGASNGGIMQSLAARDPLGRIERSDAFHWVDIGFWVRPDGRTAEAAILRGSSDTGWARPLIDHIGGRRYLRHDAETGNPGQYRVERFSYRPTWGNVTGTRIARRTGAREVHWVDLSDRDLHPEPETVATGAGPS